MGLSGEITVRDLWAKADRGSFTGSYTMSVPSHGTGLLKLSSGPAKPISAFSKIEAEHYSLQSGVQTETCSEGGENIGFIENGDYVAFNNVDFEEAQTSLLPEWQAPTIMAVPSKYGDKPDGTLAGSCTVEGTGGWQTWTEVSCNLTEISGKHNLYLRFTGGESYLESQLVPVYCKYRRKESCQTAKSTGLKQRCQTAIPSDQPICKPRQIQCICIHAGWTAGYQQKQC